MNFLRNMLLVLCGVCITIGLAENTTIVTTSLNNTVSAQLRSSMEVLVISTSDVNQNTEIMISSSSKRYISSLENTFDSLKPSLTTNLQNNAINTTDFTVKQTDLPDLRNFSIASTQQYTATTTSIMQSSEKNMTDFTVKQTNLPVVRNASISIRVDATWKVTSSRSIYLNKSKTYFSNDTMIKKSISLLSFSTKNILQTASTKSMNVTKRKTILPSKFLQESPYFTLNTSSTTPTRSFNKTDVQPTSTATIMNKIGASIISSEVFQNVSSTKTAAVNSYPSMSLSSQNVSSTKTAAVNSYPSMSPSQNISASTTAIVNSYPSMSPSQNISSSTTASVNSYPSMSPSQNISSSTTATVNSYPSMSPSQNISASTTAAVNSYPSMSLSSQSIHGTKPLNVSSFEHFTNTSRIVRASTTSVSETSSYKSKTSSYKSKLHTENMSQTIRLNSTLLNTRTRTTSIYSMNTTTTTITTTATATTPATTTSQFRHASLTSRFSHRLFSTASPTTTIHVSKSSISPSKTTNISSIKPSISTGLNITISSSAVMRRNVTSTTIQSGIFPSTETLLTRSSSQIVMNYSSVTSSSPTASSVSSSISIHPPHLLESLLMNNEEDTSLHILVPFATHGWTKLTVIVIIDGVDSKTLGTWYEIFVLKQKHNSYRAIVKTPGQQIVKPKRKRRSVTRFLDIELGKDESCTKKVNQVVCNGPLHPSFNYRIQLEVLYTNGSIGLTPTTKTFKTGEKVPTNVTDDSPSSMIIIILIVLLLFFVFLSVIISVFVCRKRRSRGQGRDKDMGVSLMSESYQKNGSGRMKKKFSGPDILMERRKSLKGMTRPVSIRDFRAWVDRSSSDSDFRFAEEFESIRDVGKLERHEIADMPENRGKNRYVNVLAYDYTRVKLASIDDEPGSDYVNASYLHGYKQPRAYIATQGPLPSTTDDFWRMVWEQNTKIIVMVTQCMERGRVKCYQYWPTAESQRYGEIVVSLANETVYSEWKEREFLLEFDGETRRLRHFQYTAWPDHGVPRSSKEMLQFILNVKFHQKPDDGPLVCHCSAGVGRTGTYLCVDILMNKLQSENNVDVYGVVCLMRTQRCSMVQTEDQYIFIHRVIMDYLKQRDEKQQIFSGYSTLEMRKKSKNDVESATEALLKDEKGEYEANDEDVEKSDDFLSEIDTELESKSIYTGSEVSA